MTRLELPRGLAARGEMPGAQAHLAEAIAALHAARVPRPVAEARALARTLGLEPPDTEPDVAESSGASRHFAPQQLSTTLFGIFCSVLHGHDLFAPIGRD